MSSESEYNDTTTITPNSEDETSMYCLSHDMQFYDWTPTGTFDLKVLERPCLERLLILQLVLKVDCESLSQDASMKHERLIVELRNHGFKNFADLCEGSRCPVDSPKRRRARFFDNVTHNILLLLLVRDAKTRGWFWEAENCLFAWRLHSLGEADIFSFRAINGLAYPMLGEDEKKHRECQLAPLMEDSSLYDATKFYRVPFHDAPDLVRKRCVYVETGFVYVTEMQFIEIIYHQFQKRLAKRLNKFAGSIYYLREDPRLEFLADLLYTQFVKLKSEEWEPETITIAELDRLTDTSYPPCMRKLHEALNERNHLRNGGRTQYTFFLKSIGLPIDDTLELYREKFTKVMTLERYEKHHAYRFRHMYGLVGSKKYYTNRNCTSIARNTIIGPQDCHGCFFVTEDIENLGKKLEDWKISSDHREKIVDLKKNEKYEEACNAYFEAIHGCSSRIFPFVAPLDFFRESKRVRKKQDANDDGESYENYADL